MISDEVYAEILFDGAAHVPIATLPDMFERTITIGSMGKTFSVTGWKVGWAIAPAPPTAAVRAVHQFVTFTNSAPFQEALADVLPVAADSGYYAQLRADYARRRDLLAGVLRGAGLQPLPIGGAYFLLTDVGKLGHASDADFCRRLVTGDRRGGDSDLGLLPASRSGPARRALLLREARRDDPRGRPAPRPPARAHLAPAELLARMSGHSAASAVQLAGVSNWPALAPFASSQVLVTAEQAGTASSAAFAAATSSMTHFERSSTVGVGEQVEGTPRGHLPVGSVG